MNFVHLCGHNARIAPSEINEIPKKIHRPCINIFWGTESQDLHVKSDNSTEPFLGVLAKLLKRGAEIRLIHAKEPGPAFREDFDRYPILKTGLERMLCPRVHFKILIFDFDTAYIGSANLTGAGIGMKSNNRRNFEAGILTDDTSLVEAAMEEFDSVWRGAHCRQCGRKQYCSDPIT